MTSSEAALFDISGLTNARVLPIFTKTANQASNIL